MIQFHEMAQDGHRHVCRVRVPLVQRYQAERHRPQQEEVGQSEAGEEDVLELCIAQGSKALHLAGLQPNLALPGAPGANDRRGHHRYEELSGLLVEAETSRLAGPHRATSLLSIEMTMKQPEP